LEGRNNCNVKKKTQQKMMMMMIEGKEKSENPAIPLAWKKKKIFGPTHNPILLNIENNDPFLPSSSVL